MGKISVCIRMLQILNTGRIYKVSELAELLDTNPRNIIEYKKELDEIVSNELGCSGFFIETVYGPHGGYKLNGNILVPALKLLPKEKDALLESYNYSLSKKDFIYKPELINAFAKIISNASIEEKDNDMVVVDRYQLSMSEEDIRVRYKFIEDAIQKKKSIEVIYNSLKGKVTHVIDPYMLFIYNNSWFFLAWNHEAGDVFYYKVNRIESFKMLNHTFVVWKYFKPENYLDQQALKNNGQYYHVVFIARGVCSTLVKERIYGKNQICSDLDNGEVKVELDMQNEDYIVSFVLKGGKDITVIEPQWLIDRAKEEATNILKNYNIN